MKRTIAIFLCLFLVSALAMPASAASAHMSISSSAGTVYRGDSFTLTVSLSNDQPVSNGAIVLSYDTSAFELVGGSCSVSNAILSEVSASKGGGVFMLQTDAVVSGAIFTINMKVKSDAAFGSYTISGTPSLNIDCTLSGTTVTVACKHSFGNASKVDGNDHQRTCSICKQTVKEGHTWNDGTVTKAPNCKETGSKTVKCTACGAESTVTLPVNDDHSFSDWSSTGGGDHYRKCSRCGKEETAEHTWYIAETLEEPTCQSSGRATIICNDCGASAQQELDPIDHTYGAPTNVTATQHTHKCTVCGTVTTADHTFGEELEHDKQMHYYACETCGYKKDQAEHEPGPAATEETDQVCLVCDRILKPKGAHVHEYLEEWSSDETNHWHDCVDCPARDTEMPHVFDSICDDTCDVCGATRKVTHLPLPTMESDETGHWNACYTCGGKQNFSAHTPGPEATVTSPQVCTDCGFEITPVLPHDHVYTGLHTHKCACGQEYETDAEECPVCAEIHKSFPWWIVCILEALVFGGVIAYLLLRKKTSADNIPEDSEADPSDDLNDLLETILSEDDPAKAKENNE